MTAPLASVETIGVVVAALTSALHETPGTDGCYDEALAILATAEDPAAVTRSLIGITLGLLRAVCLATGVTPQSKVLQAFILKVHEKAGGANG